MSRDYGEVVRALRAKARDPAVTEEEANALREKASELEVKYNLNQVPANDTVVTNRSGQPWYGMSYEEAMKLGEELLRRQHQWNRPRNEEWWDDIEDEYRNQQRRWWGDDADE